MNYFIVRRELYIHKISFSPYFYCLQGSCLHLNRVEQWASVKQSKGHINYPTVFGTVKEDSPLCHSVSIFSAQREDRCLKWLLVFQLKPAQSPFHFTALSWISVNVQLHFILTNQLIFIFHIYMCVCVLKENPFIYLHNSRQ